jgi:hypothetical protein
MVVAGILVETVPGAEPRVAVRLAREPGISLAGGDGRCRIAAVCEAADGAALEALAERLLAVDEEILGIYPTFVGRDEEG